MVVGDVATQRDVFVLRGDVHVLGGDSQTLILVDRVVDPARDLRVAEIVSASGRVCVCRYRSDGLWLDANVVAIVRHRAITFAARDRCIAVVASDRRIVGVGSHAVAVMVMVNVGGVWVAAR